MKERERKHVHVAWPVSGMRADAHPCPCTPPPPACPAVRGYAIGELGACRRFAELAAELRVPVGRHQVFAFGELGSDLGSSKEVRGTPTEWLRKVGGGSSLGLGAKLGGMRAEWVRDNNQGRWHINVTYGERF